MSDEKEIYENSPGRYHELVSREDHEGRILPSLAAVRSLAGCDVIEMGAGTGRLTSLLVPIVKSIRAFDSEPAMLRVAAEKLKLQGGSNWTLAVSSHRALPVADGSADVVLAGWTVCYAVVDHPHDWQRELVAVLAEAERVLRPGGTVILLETLGTNHETPVPPTHLVPYFEYLENVGFSKKCIRTDFRFDSLEQADELMRFFFGDKIADKVVEAGSPVVPECTGIWWRNNQGERQIS
jgi:ubiquinone/menaquinone biosynthesis C-methylase UbiE